MQSLLSVGLGAAVLRLDKGLLGLVGSGSLLGDDGESLFVANNTDGL